MTVASMAASDRISGHRFSGKTFGRLCILGAALLWSTSGLFVKSSFFDDWPQESRGVLLAFWRALFAGALLLPAVRKPALGLAAGADGLGLHGHERDVPGLDDSHHRSQRDLAAEHGALVGLSVWPDVVSRRCAICAIWCPWCLGWPAPLPSCRLSCARTAWRRPGASA